jgi:glycosyltransferase involved in cell wall biosynthesis
LPFKKAIVNHPDAKLLFAGDGQLMNMCLNLVRYLNLENQVQFLGVLMPEEYREILSESLGFVQHSITAENGDMEGTPIAVLEASAAGLPVISTTHAGVPDVVINGKTGLLVVEHDVDGMAGYMVQVLENIEKAKQQGAAGKENISANFSMERHIFGLQKILRSCVSL